MLILVCLLYVLCGVVFIVCINFVMFWIDRYCVNIFVVIDFIRGSFLYLVCLFICFIYCCCVFVDVVLYFICNIILLIMILYFIKEREKNLWVYCVFVI